MRDGNQSWKLFLKGNFLWPVAKHGHRRVYVCVKNPVLRENIDGKFSVAAPNFKSAIRSNAVSIHKVECTAVETSCLINGNPQREGQSIAGSATPLTSSKPVVRRPLTTLSNVVNAGYWTAPHRTISIDFYGVEAASTTTTSWHQTEWYVAARFSLQSYLCLSHHICAW